ncbi:MAG: HDOD domain-containing protein [Phycisphaeraceae bacterium]|nr:HDOD domain-containing protein [Phycisphaeraceae bacterium]
MKPSETKVLPAIEFDEKAHQEEIAARFREDIDQIPPLPQVAMRVLSLLQDVSSSAKNVADVITKDPTLAAALLRCANSVGLGIQNEINSVQRAVALLGYNTVRDLVFRLKMGEVIKAPKVKSPYNQTDLWIHSLAVSTVVEKLASRCLKVDRGYASTLGLLHDLGKLAINSRLTREAQRAWSPEGEMDFLQKERQVFGADHATLGAYLARRWGLPEALAIGIGRHHYPEQVEETSLTLSQQRAVQLVHVANQLVKYCHVYGPNTQIAQVDPYLLQCLGLDENLELLLDRNIQSAISRSIFYAESLSLDAGSEAGVTGSSSLWLYWGKPALQHAKESSTQQPPSPRVRIGGQHWKLINAESMPDDRTTIQTFDLDKHGVTRPVLEGRKAVRFTASPTAQGLSQLSRATIDHQRAMEIPQSVTLPTRFVMRRLLGRIGKHAHETERVTVHQSLTQGRFVLGLQTPSLAFVRRLGAEATPELAAALIGSELATILNLGWYSHVDTSPAGDALLLITPKFQ